jgi:hypothetical protein
MEITLVEGCGNGYWLRLVAHLRDGDIPIDLYESPTEGSHGLEGARKQVKHCLEKVGITIQCGKVVDSILDSIDAYLVDPPEGWVVSALPLNSGKVYYKACLGDFQLPSDYHGYALQSIQFWMDKGMNQEEILKMFNK